MSDWQIFIDTQIAETCDENYICDASQLGLILIAGEDANSFLQNQFSNDINEVTNQHFQLSSYSTPKGRILAIFRVVSIDNGYLLVLPISLVTPVIQRLQRYVVQARVSLTDASTLFSRFAIQTDNARVTSQKILPATQGKAEQSDSLITLHLGSVNGQQRYLLLSLSVDEAKSIWQNLSDDLQTAHFDAWRLSEIKAGIPVIYPQNTEQFVAQMTNLDLLGAVNFKKGCYPGQEIVARTQYLGKLKRRMFLAQVDSDICPHAGDNLVKTGIEAADGSGKIIDAVIDHHGICYCLFVGQIASAENNGLELLRQPQTTITLLKLPYSLPAE
ncbi:MAG: folate-binding protein YgfZ [Gammaproteobacteria bacterium]|nr:folate-binding protein YgfZ [Gammaproteobacteria bacterium]